MIEFTLDGLVPSKKNNRRLFQVDGRYTSAPSKQHDDWFQEQKQYLELSDDLRGYQLPITAQPVYIAYVFCMPDLVHRDLSNMIQSIEDLISTKGKNKKQGVGIITDDSWRYLQCAGFIAFHVKGEAWVKVAIEDEIEPLQKWLLTNAKR